jgi:hypothetical protein
MTRIGCLCLNRGKNPIDPATPYCLFIRFVYLDCRFVRSKLPATQGLDHIKQIRRITTDDGGNDDPILSKNDDNPACSIY